MKDFKHAFKYGAIGALIMILGWLISNWLFAPDEGELYDFEMGEYLGFTAMFLSFIAVFVGIKKYRDNELKGQMTFKQAFFIGLQIVAVTSVIYVVCWMIYFPNFMADFPEQYMANQMREYQEAGMSTADLKEKQTELDEWVTLYENPVAVAGFTFLEIFPIGLVVVCICGLILRRKP